MLCTHSAPSRRCRHQCHLLYSLIPPLPVLLFRVGDIQLPALDSTERRGKEERRKKSGEKERERDAVVAGICWCFLRTEYICSVQDFASEQASHSRISPVLNSILHPESRRVRLNEQIFSLRTLLSLFLSLLLLSAQDKSELKLRQSKEKEQLQAWPCALNPGAFISSLILHPSSFVSVSPCQHSTNYNYDFLCLFLSFSSVQLFVDGSKVLASILLCLLSTVVSTCHSIEYSMITYCHLKVWSRVSPAVASDRHL